MQLLFLNSSNHNTQLFKAVHILPPLNTSTEIPQVALSTAGHTYPKQQDGSLSSFWNASLYLKIAKRTDSYHKLGQMTDEVVTSMRSNSSYHKVPRYTFIQQIIIADFFTNVFMGM